MRITISPADCPTTIRLIVFLPQTPGVCANIIAQTINLKRDVDSTARHHALKTTRCTNLLWGSGDAALSPLLDEFEEHRQRDWRLTAARVIEKDTGQRAAAPIFEHRDQPARGQVRCCQRLRKIGHAYTIERSEHEQVKIVDGQ